MMQRNTQGSSLSLECFKCPFIHVFEEWFKTYQDIVELTTSARTDDLFRPILPSLVNLKISKINSWQCQELITEKVRLLEYYRLSH